jgi:hypothetical protein
MTPFPVAGATVPLAPPRRRALCALQVTVRAVACLRVVPTTATVATTVVTMTAPVPTNRSAACDRGVQSSPARQRPP